MSGHAITTATGLRFSYDDPQPDQICVEDVAVALGNCCRFAGHVRHFYSVAEHSCLVHKLVVFAGFDAHVALAALWHDGHEAYLTDVPTPLKRKIQREAPGVWEEMEGAIDKAIATHLGFDPALFHHDAVKAADHMALMYEAAVLKSEDAEIWGTMHQEIVGAREIAPDYVIGYGPEDSATLFSATHKLALHETRFLP